MYAFLPATSFPAGKQGNKHRFPLRADVTGMNNGRPGRPSTIPLDYTPTGTLSMEYVLNGDAEQFRHLDPIIETLVLDLQNEMVAGGGGESIEEFRKNPTKRKELISRVDRQALKMLMEKKSRLYGDEQKFAIASAVNDIVGLGPIEPLWTDPAITEVMVNGPETVYVEREGLVTRATGVRFRSREHVLHVAQRILAPLNRKVDVKNPLEDGRLPDGSRVNVVHWAIAPAGPVITIRRFPTINRSIVDLVHLGAMNEEMAKYLTWLISNKATSLIVGGTGSGKALSVATPIPTPEGFVQMGDLTVGDTVFDEWGEPVTVTGAYDTMFDHDCYTVKLSDGTEIVADGEHLWEIQRRKHYIIPDTELPPEENSFDDFFEELSPTGKYDKADEEEVMLELDEPEIVDTRTVKRLTELGVECHIRVCEPVQFPEKVFPVPPKNMGWLIQARNTALYQQHRSKRKPHKPSRNAGLPVPEVVIPDEYFTGSEWQRWELLFGLFDGVNPSRGSDQPGWNLEEEETLVLEKVTVSAPDGTDETFLVNTVHMANLDDLLGVGGKRQRFVSCCRELALQVQSLISSLGFVATVEKDVSWSGIPLWLVGFATGGGNLQGLRSRGARGATSSLTARHTPATRAVLAVEQAGTVPVRCIKVDSPTSLFLAGETFIPTHNTTLLNALSAAIPKDERIITIEDSLELRLDPQSHFVAMEARPADPKGENQIPIRLLVKNSLRMRPNRIVVGEIRDEAALDMLQACNTGHEGSMSTVHANGPDEALSRLTVMVAQGGEIPAHKVNELVCSALDLIIMIRRYKDGSRRLSGIYEIPKYSGETLLETVPLWEWERTGTEDGKLVGRYKQVGEMSDALREKLALEFEPMPSWEDVQRMCSFQAEYNRAATGGESPETPRPHVPRRHIPLSAPAQPPVANNGAVIRRPALTVPLPVDNA